MSKTQPQTNKNIIICADDFAFNDEVSYGILKLAKGKKISATSCMTNMPAWPRHSQLLKPLLPDIDVGLHFNLTEGKPLSKRKNSFSDTNFFPLNNLIAKAYCHRLIKAEVKAELNAQIAAFLAKIGRMPAFIDGHQHIQQFPIIREAIIDVYQTLNLRQYNTYLRISSNGLFASLHQPQKLKAIILTLLGSIKFRKLLMKNNITHNTSFAGIYDFSEKMPYATYFVKFLKQLNNNGILMCHPALPNPTNNDRIAIAKANEYNFFISTAFQQICTNSNISVNKFLN